MPKILKSRLNQKQIKMIDYYKKVVLENYANFSGRARRSEYWYFVLANILIFFGLMIISVAVSAAMGNEGLGMFFMVVMILYGLYIIIPSLALAVRRMHDIGKSGWYYFVQFIPFIGGIWFLVLLCTDGDHGTNAYGADPKNDFSELEEIGSEQ